jgi:hypothetical protein
VTGLSAGASAVNDLLARHPAANVRVFVVWKPMLASDVTPTTRFTMQRIADRRVRQYWDEQHTLARRMNVRTRRQHY